MVKYQIILGSNAFEEEDGVHPSTRILINLPEDIDPEEFKNWSLEEGFNYILNRAKLSNKEKLLIEELEDVMENPEMITYSIQGELQGLSQLKNETIGSRLKLMDIEGGKVYSLTYFILSHGGKNRKMKVNQIGLRAIATSPCGNCGRERLDTVLKVVPKEIDTKDFYDWTLEEGLSYVVFDDKTKSFEEIKVYLDEKPDTPKDDSWIMDCFVNNNLCKSTDLKTERVADHIRKNEDKGIDLITKTILYDLNWHL